MGVIRNQRPKIHRSKLVLNVGGPFRTISKIDLARSYKNHTFFSQYESTYVFTLPLIWSLGCSLTLTFLCDSQEMTSDLTHFLHQGVTFWLIEAFNLPILWPKFYTFTNCFKRMFKNHLYKQLQDTLALYYFYRTPFLILCLDLYCRYTTYQDARRVRLVDVTRRSRNKYFTSITR